MSEKNDGGPACEKMAAAQAFQAADDAWASELVRCFGKAGHGGPGSFLRQMYDARSAARIRWEATIRESA